MATFLPTKCIYETIETHQSINLEQYLNHPQKIDPESARGTTHRPINAALELRLYHRQHPTQNK